MSGSLRSVNTTSGRCSATSRRPCDPVSAQATSYPFFSRWNLARSSISGSSSMTRTFALLITPPLLQDYTSGMTCQVGDDHRQFLRLYGFGHMHREARRERFNAIARPLERRQRNRRDFTTFLGGQFANALYQHITVFVGHANVRD